MNWFTSLPVCLALIGGAISFFGLRDSRGIVSKFGWVGLIVTCLVFLYAAVAAWVFVPALPLALASIVVIFSAQILSRNKQMWIWVSAAGVFVVASLGLVAASPTFIMATLLKSLEPKSCNADLWQVEQVIKLPAATPELYENFWLEEDGSYLVTAATRAEVLRVSPGGEVDLIATLPAGEFDLMSFTGMISGIVKDRDGIIYTLVNSKSAQDHGLWRIDEANGPKLEVLFPPDTRTNGMDIDQNGRFFVADSATGSIWRVAGNGASPQLWHQSSESGSKNRLPFPTANGLKLLPDQVILSNTQGKRIIRVEITQDGSAGDLQTLSTGIAADDFAVAMDGRIFLTTHPFNSVIEIGSGQACSFVSDVTTFAMGPTAALYDGERLHVLNDGGFSKPVEGGFPSIVVLRPPN